MKAIQILIDGRCSSGSMQMREVKRDGRSAVLRRAVAEYLRRRRSRAIAESLPARVKGDGLGTDFAGWADEGAWPET
jgi:hypothetical protein